MGQHKQPKLQTAMTVAMSYLAQSALQLAVLALRRLRAPSTRGVLTVLEL